jgi:hypothetical protein
MPTGPSEVLLHLRKIPSFGIHREYSDKAVSRPKTSSIGRATTVFSSTLIIGLHLSNPEVIPNGSPKRRVSAPVQSAIHPTASSGRSSFSSSGSRADAVVVSFRASHSPGGQHHPPCATACTCEPLKVRDPPVGSW